MTMRQPHDVPSCSNVESLRTSRNPHATQSCSNVESLRTSRNPHATQSCSNIESLRASRNPQDILNAITARYPCPTLSGFERAYWLYQTREAVRWIDRFISDEYKLQLAEIEYNSITSDVLEIVPIERQDSRVDVDRLRKRFPDIFNQLVHIRASEAQKILGRHALYNLARERIGEDAIREFEIVNVGDLEKVLTPHQTMGLIDTYTKVTDWKVQEVEP